jgi:hypothetical protein
MRQKMTDALQHHWLESRLYLWRGLRALHAGKLGAIDTDKAPLLWDSWDFDGSIVPSKDMKFA